MAQRYEAVVVGAGPNGLAAAITLAREGKSVAVFEASETVGGGARSAERTRPGFVHDVCSAVHPLAAASPFFRELPLARHGLEWVHPTYPFAQPLEGGAGVALERAVDTTAESLGEDARAYRKIFGNLVEDWPRIERAVLGPVWWRPKHPVALTRFGLRAIRSARGLAMGKFDGPHAQALFAGSAAHAILPLERPFTASFGLMLGVLGHTVGWPFPRGGAGRIPDALAAHLRELGGEIHTGHRIDSLGDLPPARAVLCDVTPGQLVRMAGDRLRGRGRRRLLRFRHGPGVFKLDYALDGPVPWASEACQQAGTVHVGGSFDEVATAERAVGRGEHPERPFVLVAQHSPFDDTRAPEGKHTLWAYCHVPSGSPVDMTERVERQIERYAPGFRNLVAERSVMTPGELEQHNENNVGGDISGGAHDGLQLFARPTLSLVPYATPLDDVYLCSSSTPPGAGVHGMCGHLAARVALRRSFG